MKMKILIFLSLFFVVGSLRAQSVTVDVLSYNLNFQKDSLVVTMNLQLHLSGMGLNSSVVLIPVISDENRKTELPGVLLNGKKRQRAYSRQMLLQKRKGTGSGTPMYRVIKIDDQNLQEVDYRITVGVENWMRMADLALKCEVINDNDEYTQQHMIPVAKQMVDFSSTPSAVNSFPLSGEQRVDTLAGVRLQLKGSYLEPENDAIDERNQKELKFNLEEARVIAEINPRMLSLRELYTVAQSYKDNKVQFYKVINTSISIYPSHPVANLNAAAVAIEQGNASLAKKYLQIASRETMAYKNCCGAYELLCGNIYEGIRLLKQAQTEGSKEASLNLKEFFEKNKRRE